MNRRTENAIAICDLIIETMQRTKVALPELLRRNRFAPRDGYPSTSMGGPGQRGAINRPTESTALSKPMPDPVGQAVRDLLKMLEQLAQDANSIDGRRQVALSNPIAPFPPCGNCSRALPMAGDGRCDACYRYKRRTGNDRPVGGDMKAI